MPRSHPSTWIAVSLAAALTAAPIPARASMAGEALFFTAVVAGAAAVAGLSVYDVVVAAKHQEPTKGAAIAEVVVGAPQAILYGPVFAADVTKHDDGSAIIVLSLVPAAWASGVAAHGALALSHRVRPELTPAVAMMIGVNTSLTTFGVASLFRRGLPSRTIGITEMVLTAPQIAVAIPAAVRSPGDRNAWIGAAAWSGGLFLHGVAATLWGRHEETRPPADPPDMPPPPERPPLLVPASIDFGPAPIAGAASVGVGIAVRGVLF